MASTIDEIRGEYTDLIERLHDEGRRRGPNADGLRVLFKELLRRRAFQI